MTDEITNGGNPGYGADPMIDPLTGSVPAIMPAPTPAAAIFSQAPNVALLSYIMGTEKKPDYIVIGQNGKIILGVKPIIHGAKKSLWFGVRLRSTKGGKDYQSGPTVGGEDDDDSGTVVQFVGAQIGPEALTNAWPNVKFDPTKVDGTRASQTVGMFIAAPTPDFEAIREVLVNKENFYGVLYSLLCELVPAEFRVGDYIEAVRFIWQSHEKMIADMENATSAAKAAYKANEEADTGAPITTFAAGLKQFIKVDTPQPAIEAPASPFDIPLLPSTDLPQAGGNEGGDEDQVMTPPPDDAPSPHGTEPSPKGDDIDGGAHPADPPS